MRGGGGAFTLYCMKQQDTAAKQLLTGQRQYVCRGSYEESDSNYSGIYHADNDYILHGERTGRG